MMDQESPLTASSPVTENGDLYNNQQKTESGWTWPLALAAVTTTLGCAVPAGYHIGVVNNPQVVMKEFCNQSVLERFGIEMSQAQLDVLWSAVVSSFIVGGIIGSLCASWLANFCGRKGSIVVTDVLGIVAAICFIVSKNVNSVELLVAGRLVVGLSAGLTTAVVPMYLTELSPIQLRGSTGVLCPLGLTIGVLFSQILGLNIILGTAASWHYLLALYAVLIIITAFALPALPESPKYLYVIRGLEDGAIKVLRKLRNSASDSLHAEIDSLKQERRGQQQAGDWSALSVFKDSKLTLPLLLVISMQAGQQLSGVNAVFYYSSEIFRQAGLPDLEAQLGSLGAGVVNLVVVGLAVYTMHRYPRRKLILLSCTGAAVSLCLLTISITYNKSAAWLTYVPIAAVMLYVFFYNLGLGPLPYFVGSELFQVGPRPVAMAWGSMANWAGNFLVGMTFPSLTLAIGQYVFIFYIMVVVCLTYFLYVYFPETKGVEQHEVAAMLQNGFQSKVNRSARKNTNNSVDIHL